MRFAKYHGLGNDFLVVDLRNERGDDAAAVQEPEVVKALCDRQFGVGGDGVLAILPGGVGADARMRVLNSDGSEAEMCGNGIRCVAKELYDRGGIKKDRIAIDTGAGRLVCAIEARDGVAETVTVEMGAPRLLRGEIPMTGPANERCIEQPLEIIAGQPARKITGVSMGNPHAISFVTNESVRTLAETVGPSKKEGFVLAYSTDTKRPRFYSIIEGDTLFIAADTLRMFSVFDSLSGDTIRHIQAYHDVRIYKSDMQGKMDSLIYDDQDSVFVFFGTPVLWSDTTQFSADSIRMTLRNKQIHEIEMHRQALILSEQLGTYYDQIKGRIIVASFDSSELKNMWVTGNAESVYYTRDDHQAYIGVNKTICSKMHFTFLAGAIQALRYYGENTSNMLPMNEADHTGMRLEGFQWRMPERPNSPFDLLY